MVGKIDIIQLFYYFDIYFIFNRKYKEIELIQRRLYARNDICAGQAHEKIGLTRILLFYIIHTDIKSKLIKQCIIALKTLNR